MNDPAHDLSRCGAKTRSGAPCAKFPMEGKRRCRLHGGLSTGPKTVAGRAAISAANTKHGRYKNWRERQAKERYYQGEIKRVMQEAREAGLLAGKLSMRDAWDFPTFSGCHPVSQTKKLRKLKN